MSLDFSNNIDFILTEFDSSFTMDLCANIQGETIEPRDVSATAVFIIDVSYFHNVFKFSTDSSDIDTQTNGSPFGDVSDVFYFVLGDQWDASSTHAINPANASLNRTSVTINGKPIQTTHNAIYSSPSENRNLVKHDFVRHIAQHLFNTHFGVDLFDNETLIKQDLETQGRAVNEHIKSVITDASNGFNDSGFYTNDNSGNENLSRELLRQIIDNDPQRLDASGGVFDPTQGFIDSSYSLGDKISVPLVAGDTVSFKVSIDAATGQEKLLDPTRADPVPTRSYRIKIILGDGSVNYVTPDDALNDSEYPTKD